MRKTFLSHEMKYRIIKQTKKFIYFNADEIHLLGLCLYIYVKWCIVFLNFLFVISLRRGEHCTFIYYIWHVFLLQRWFTSITIYIHFYYYVIYHPFYNITKFRQLTFYRWKKKMCRKIHFYLLEKFSTILHILSVFQKVRKLFNWYSGFVENVLNCASYLICRVILYIEKICILKFFENLFPLEL